MKIEILLNLPKTINGKPLGPFTAGQVCELDDSTAQLFIDSAMAKAYEEPKPEPDPAAVEAQPGEVGEVAGDGTGEALPEIVEGASNEHEAPARRSRRQAD